MSKGSLRATRSAKQKKPERYNVHFWWGEGSPETRERVEKFYRSPEGQERLRKIHERTAHRISSARGAATKDVKEN